MLAEALRINNDLNETDVKWEERKKREDVFWYQPQQKQKCYLEVVKAVYCGARIALWSYFCY